MPEFKKEGRGFKMKGWSPFTKDDENISADSTPTGNKVQNVIDQADKKYDHIFRKRKGLGKMMKEGLKNVVFGPGYQIYKLGKHLHKKKKS